MKKQILYKPKDLFINNTASSLMLPNIQDIVFNIDDSEGLLGVNEKPITTLTKKTNLKETALF